MTLNDLPAAPFGSEVFATLDDLFRKAAKRRPDAIALCDPPNRSSFTDGGPRRLTYRDSDHIVSAITGRLQRLGLSSETVVALQLPNTVESALTLLAVLRAGLIAAPLPMLWRHADVAAALSRVGAKAIVTTSRIGAAAHCEIAMAAAAEVFAVRYVCTFGEKVPDGVIPLDDLLDPREPLQPASPVQREGGVAPHVAIVTFEMTPDGLVTVARNHAELMAGAQAVALEAGLPEHATILAGCGSGSFAGLVTGILPWLLTGGTLSLHQPFDPAVFEEQCRRDTCDTVVVPGAMVPRFAQAGLPAIPGLRRVLALWRAPERLLTAVPWQYAHVGLTDVLAFGETAVISRRRGVNGEAAGIPLGAVPVPREGSTRVQIAETTVTPTGTLAIRGAMVPRHAFSAGAERTPFALFNQNAEGFADTHHPCRAQRDSGTVQLTGPPGGMISVGGYRFSQDKLNQAVSRTSNSAAIAALPDAIGGHRLAGQADDHASVRQGLKALGVNALVSEAFADRRRTGPISP